MPIAPTEEPQTEIEPSPPLSVQRKAIGLGCPSYKAKREIWSSCQSAIAGIDKYVPARSLMYAHKADARGVAISGGWRAGKSLGSSAEIVSWLPYAELIWLIAVDYDTSRQEFLYAAEMGMSTGLVNPADVRISQNKYQPCTMISVTNCRIETRTLSDYRKLAAQPPDVIVVCEPGLIDNLTLVMELLMGRVSQRRGMIWLAGTSDEASEEWYQLWEQWDQPNIIGGKSFSIPTWENLHSFPQGMEERDLRAYRELYGEEAFLAHYGGIPASPRNLVLRGFWSRDLNIDEDIEFSTDFPVELAIDPNYALGNRYSVEVMQWNDGTGEEWIVDEVAMEGATHPQVIEECQSRDWWKYVSGGVIDPYAGESHVYGAPAPVTYWEPHVELRTDHRPRVNSTVQALKSALIGDQVPPLRVSPRCERFIYEASRWRQEKTGKPSVRMCDALKAAGYWLFDRRAMLMASGLDNESNLMEAKDWSFDA